MPNSRVTSARQVHAIIAAAVDDPSLLQRLRRETKRSKPQTALPIDFERVRLFAGLAVKVRQNDLRRSLPLTFRLFDALKISIELFASYAKQAASLRKANKKSQADKIQSLFEFLDQWLDRKNPQHTLIWDIIRHERVLLELREAACATSVQFNDATKSTVTAKSRPARGRQILHHLMSCDPIRLEQLIRNVDGQFSEIQRGQFHYIYRWDGASACVSIEEIDQLGFVLIELANGRRSVARISNLLCEADIAVDTESLCRAVQELIEHEILTLAE